MSGLVVDNGFPKLISQKTHSIIDYIHAGTNFVVGALFWRRGNRAAANAAFFLGGNVLLNTLMTDYEYGVFRVWSFKVHGVLDYAVAATSSALPPLLAFDEDSAEARYFYGQGAGETLIAGLSDYDDNSGARRIQSSRYDLRSQAA
jgi:hypothetical protein